MRGVLLLVGCAWAAVTNDTVKFEPQREVAPLNRRWIQERSKNLTFDDDVAALIALISETNCKAHLFQLTGEGSDQVTRVSNSLDNPNGIVAAVKYVQDKMEEYGFDVELNHWDSTRGPNVISTLVGSGSPKELIILGAHLDDIPATGRAPGANDDGSGSSALLCMAQAIKQFRDTQGVTFSRTLVFEHYTGEEQGLLGSRAWAKVRAARSDFVAAMIQTDMSAVKLSADPLGLAFVDDPKATDPDLTEMVKSLANFYKDPTLTLYSKVLSGSSCCSDHQAYKEQGFPSAGLIEPRGYTGDPQYHKVGDVANRPEYSITQLTLAARAMLAAGGALAEIVR
jgi:hypothetical protein